MTAELAIALPAVVLVLVAILALAAASTAQMRSADAARAAARAAALGQPDAEIAAVARSVAGDRARVSVVRAPPWVTVTVASPVVTGWAGLAPLTATGEATAWIEP